MALDNHARPVLYLDDEKDLCSLLQDSFAAQGIDVETVSTPGKALARVRKHHYEVVIVDYHLKGGKNGVDDFLRKARRHLKESRCIVVSVETSHQIGRDANDVGAEYAVKNGESVAFAAHVCGKLKKSFLLPSEYRG